MQEILKEKLRSKLRLSQSSLTSCRLAIFDAFDGHTTLSMNQLVALLPDIDRATVYRTIKLYEALGIINRLHYGWKYKLELSDDFSPHHHHLTCNNCGKIIVTREDELIEKDIRRLANTEGFMIQEHQLEIYGLCSACKTK